MKVECMLLITIIFTLCPLITTTATMSKSSKSDPYCNCDVDKNGFPSGWSFSDIWLDVVFILDTSEAMGKDSLTEATGLIELFISDGENDFLITDETTEFHTRVGVISMSDTVEVLYDLNMTKSDRLGEKTAISQGAMDVKIVKAFEEAHRMLISKGRPDTRKVIYYMATSDPWGDLIPANHFKESKGIIIVNDMSTAGQLGLKKLASPGYYFSNQNYLSGLQSLCKANCFCNSQERHAFGGADPAIEAAGGCYHFSPVGLPFNNAKATCTHYGGILATIHDDEKAKFLQKLTNWSKWDNFWMGYQKTDEGVWKWHDQSTNPYTNWDTNEPSSDDVAKCAYVDTTNLTWSAGNCQRGFPLVCQYAPCSVGNKNC